jgi:hypothetical protein
MHLLSSIERYLRASGTPPTRFGREAVGDPRFVLDLRRGREPRPRTVSRVCAYLVAQQLQHSEGRH